jgi:hypothetical protein
MNVESWQICVNASHYLCVKISKFDIEKEAHFRIPEIETDKFYIHLLIKSKPNVYCDHSKIGTRNVFEKILLKRTYIIKVLDISHLLRNFKTEFAKNYILNQG